MISPIQRTRCSQLCTVVAALALLVAFAAPAAAQLVPYGSRPPADNIGTPGYRYKIVAQGATDAAFPSCTGLDDTWQHGAAPWFGEPEPCELPNCNPGLCVIYQDAETPWVPSVSDILVCYTVELCGELDTIDDVSLRVDNDAAVFVDGVAGTVTSGVGEAGDGNAPFCWAGPADDPDNDGLSTDGLCMSEGCPDSGPLPANSGTGQDKMVFTGFAAAGAGEHIIAVRARNRTQLSFLDIEVNGTGEVGPCAEVCVGDDDDDDDDDDDTQELKDE